MGMTQFKDFVYWIDSGTKTVERADKSDGSNHTIIQKLKDGVIVTDLMVFHASKQTGRSAFKEVLRDLVESHVEMYVRECGKVERW